MDIHPFILFSAVVTIAVCAVCLFVHARLCQIERYMEERFIHFYGYLNDTRQLTRETKYAVSEPREYLLTPRDIEND